MLHIQQVLVVVIIITVSVLVFSFFFFPRLKWMRRVRNKKIDFFLALLVSHLPLIFLFDIVQTSKLIMKHLTNFGNDIAIV